MKAELFHFKTVFHTLINQPQGRQVKKRYWPHFINGETELVTYPKTQEKLELCLKLSCVENLDFVFCSDP